MTRRHRPELDNQAVWPQFCCAILRDANGRYLLEKRRADDEAMPGQLVCFGGGREPDEHPDECIRRELREEVGWTSDSLELCLRLLGDGDRVIGWFYRGVAPGDHEIVTEAGVQAVWAEWETLDTLPIGNWNLAAIIAERHGLDVARVRG